MLRGIVAVSIVFVLVLLPAVAAAWQSDGTPVCTAANNQYDLRTSPDGSGGMLLTWADFRAMAFDAYVQRLDPAGNGLWGTDGIDVDPTGPGQIHPDVCPDGAGGAWVVWQRGIITPIDVHVQHFDADGDPDLFGDGGIVVASGGTSANNLRPVCVTDRFGGVIVAWVREKVGGHEVRAQRVDASGTVRWSAGGVVIGNDPDASAELDIVSNSSKSYGAFVSWISDLRTGRVQWVDVTGAPRWGGSSGTHFGIVNPGSRVRLADRDRSSGGVYVAFRFTASSSIPWGADRLAVASIDSSTYGFWTTVVDTDTIDDRRPGPDPRMIPDGMGGCIVAWDRFDDTGDGAGVYMQRLDPLDGEELWNGGNPNLVSDEEAGNHAPDLAIDHGVWGSYVAWLDDDVDGVSRVRFCYVERQYGWSGTEALVPGGYSSERPHVVAEPGGGFDPIVAWEDERKGTETDVYAAGMQQSGTPSAPNLIVRSVSFADDPAEVGETTTSRIVAANLGNVASGAFDLAFYHDLSSPPSPGQLPNGPIFEHPGLAPGDSAVFTGDILSLYQTTFQTWAFVDFREDVDEIDAEDDNILGPVPLQWVLRPNLTVTSFTPSAETPAAGETVTATIEITNDGHATASVFDVDFYEHRPSAPVPDVAGDQTRRIGDLDVGETVTWETDPFTWPDVVVRRAWVQVDTQEEVDEWKEDDNVAGPLDIEWSYPLEPGWPVNVSGMTTSPAIATLAGDVAGPRHVVFATATGGVHALDAGGEALPGWPYTSDEVFTATVAVGDVVAGGGLEVVAASESGDVLCLSSAGTLLWTHPMKDTITATPVLFDLTGDSGCEVIVGTHSGTLIVLDGDGNAVSGWPVSLGSGVGLRASPLVGRLDGSTPMIVAVATPVVKHAPQSRVHVLHADGTSIGAPWPLSLPTEVVSSPVAADVGGDDTLEFFFGDLSGRLHGYTLSGGTGPFPVSLVGAIVTNPGVWDADGDGDPEILFDSEELVGGFPSYRRHHAWMVDGDGLVVTSWPHSWGSTFHGEGCAGGPIDWGHGKSGRAVFGSSLGTCHVLDPNANELPCSVLNVDAPVAGTPAVGDLDGDGHFELVIAGDGVVTCFDLLAGSYQAAALQWPMDRHDPQRTGVYGFATATSVTPPVVTGPSRLDRGRPNPFNASVTLPYFVDRAGRVTVDVYDVSGRHVATLLDVARGRGDGVVHWTAVDHSGRRVASGVFLVRLRIDGREVDVERVTLVE